MEDSAAVVLKRALELDLASRFQESLICYQEGIDLLLSVLKATKDEKKKAYYRNKISEYMNRAEKIKTYVMKEKEDGKCHKQIKIEENSKGFSYEKLFQEYLNETVTEVWVEDPYIRQAHQGHGKSQQMSSLEEIQQSLRDFGITLDISYSSSIHDREIRFNNGWMFKIGRGLDYFKKPKVRDFVFVFLTELLNFLLRKKIFLQGRFCLGYCDFDLRPCHETTVDIFHNKYTKKI
ncbi:MIT domain-containing protein 1 isoform 3-T4 [Vipera latastei]